MIQIFKMLQSLQFYLQVKTGARSTEKLGQFLPMLKINGAMYLGTYLCSIFIQIVIR